jgi:hypothetical protein
VIFLVNVGKPCHAGRKSVIAFAEEHHLRGPAVHFAKIQTCYWCAGLSTPARACYISNTCISVTVENWTSVHVIFLTGNGLRNNILKY